MIALVDCNNFYASCERLFNPKLNGKPIAVLSSNDGCIVARSDEVKKLGIPMGAPAYKYKTLIELNNVNLFSANFTLYGDMSRRVMQILKDFSPDVEIYSIDEAFLHLDSLHQKDYYSFAMQVINIVKKWTGVPISVGIAPTKTLAKLANKIAKKNKHLNGVFIIENPTSNYWKDYLDYLQINDVWGIGYGFVQRLNKNGIYTIRQFMDSNEQFIRSIMGVGGLRTHSELHGVKCIMHEKVNEPHKSIISSRTFSRPVTDFNELKESISTFTARAAQKLRKNKSSAYMIHVWIKTNKHRTDIAQYYGYDFSTLEMASSYTPELIEHAVEVLKRIYKQGYTYKKSAVMLTGIVPSHQVQLNLFNKDYPLAKRVKIMQAVDKLNKELGSRTINFGSMGTFQPWKPKSEKRSPRYTTSWSELFSV